MNDATDKQTRKTKHLVIKLFVFAVLMFGFCYALVPLYNVLCKATGLNGKIDGKAAVDETQAIDTARTVTVQFLTTTNANLNWQFRPDVKQVTVHPGETKRVTFFAKNDTQQTMTVQAIPSVTPGMAAKYLKKTQCFCFERQTLAAGESKDMPMIFHLDPELPQEYNTVTIAYTLFDTSNIKTKTNVTPGRITN